MRSHIQLSALCLLMLTACSGGWFGGDDDDKPLAGKRISVLEHRESLSTDKTLSSMPVTLPSQQNNNSWTLQQYAPVQHPAWGGSGKSDTTGAVDGGNSSVRLTSTPIIANGVIYTLGAGGDITARREDNISKELWEHRIVSGTEDNDVMGVGIILGSSEKEFLGGNIAYDQGMIFAATRRGDVLALDANSGELKWQRNVKLPVKSAPVVKDNRLFVITTDNRLYALATDTGDTLWIHAGIAETTSMFGAPSPTATENWVIVPYSSGEIHALEARTGSVVWSDVLASDVRRRPSSINLSGNATPVISHGVVYATSYDGVLAAFDLTSGNRIWVQDIGGLYSPWVAGDFVYILTSDNQVICLHGREGKVKWVAGLPLHGEGGTFSDKGDRIIWSGPVLAGGKLLLAGSNGALLELSPQDGKVIGQADIPDGVMLPPVVANGTVYVLSNSGTLGAVR